MKTNQKLFTSGEFAFLCGVKKQTLFHYDDIGLLIPEYKNNKGYRYYSVQQAEIFSVIEMLKEIGMSLTEIKEFFHSQTLEQTITLLTEKEKVMDQKIKKMQHTQQMIKNKKQHIKEALDLNYDCLTIEQKAPEYYIRSENILDCSDKEFTKTIMQFIKYTKQKHLDTGYPIGGIIQQEQIENGDYLKYAYTYIRVDKSAVKDPFIREAGKYVTGYHKGHYVTINETYNKIKNYLNEVNYRISGDSFEEYIIDGASTSEENNYVTKIMIKVEEK